jgi:hypothetical protein
MGTKRRVSRTEIGARVDSAGAGRWVDNTCVLRCVCGVSRLSLTSSIVMNGSFVSIEST